MTFKNDIVAYDAAGQLVLVVEVKNNRGTDKEWAAQTRRNLFAHGQIANAPYFLLALPDQFYLWVDKHKHELIAPDFSVDPFPLLAPYLGTDFIPESLSSTGFEMVVEAWLATLTWAGEPSANGTEYGNWLLESGLLEALKRGRLAYEVAV